MTPFPPRPPATVLIADDSREIREFWADSILRPAGYTVILAPDGGQALSLILERRPDVILADWQMPGLTGLDLKRTLARMGDETPVILITAQGSENIASEATLAGVAGYLAKPVDMEVLLAAVEHARRIEWLRRDRAATVVALERRVYQLETLQAIGQALTASLDISQVLNYVVDAAVRLTEADAGSLFLLQDNSSSLTLRAHRAPEDNAARAGKQPAADGLALQVIGSGQPLLWSPDSRGDSQPAAAPGHPALYLPLRVRSHVAGVLAVDNRRSGRSFQDSDVGPLSILADYGSVAIANARLFAEVQLQSVTDSLTGVYNRRHLFNLAERELQRALRFRRPLAAVMFDIDLFKHVNDAHGHAVGDQVIAEVTRRCRAAIRAIDVFGRYGGDEFALVLPETASDGARQLADRLRNVVAGTPIATGAGLLAATISLGVAGINPDMHQAADLFAAADAGLYAAKRSGRNRVAVAG